MKNTKAEQKLVSFTKDSNEFHQVKEDMQSGWNIVSLSSFGIHYVGIMERRMADNSNDLNEISIFIPPRKKIKIVQ